MISRLGISVLLCVFAIASPGRVSAQNLPGKPDLPAKPIAPAKQYRYWTTNWSFKDIDLKDLAGKLRPIGLELPVPVSGRATVEFRVSVPVNALRTGRAYRIEGALTVRKLVADELRFDLVHADVAFSDGELKLKQFRCVERVSPGKDNLTETGTVTGDATAQLLPRGEFQADVEVHDFAVGPLAKLLSRFGIGSDDQAARGELTASVLVSGAVENLGSPDQWNIAGDLNATKMRRGDSISFDLAAKEFRLRDKQLTVQRLRLESVERPTFFLDASVSLGLAETTRFDMKVRANDVPLADLLGLYRSDLRSIVEGKLDADGAVSGVIGGPSGLEAFDVQLAVASPSISVAGIDLGLLEHDVRFTTDHLSMLPRGEILSDDSSTLIVRSFESNYALNDQWIRVANLNARIFGGEVTGDGEFARKDGRSHRIDASWIGIEPRIAISIASLPRPMPLSVRTSGEVDWSVPAENILQPAKHHGTISMKLEKIGLGGQNIGAADIAISVNQGELEAELVGKVFGGNATIRATALLDGIGRWPEVPSRLQIREFSLADLSMRQMLRTVMVERSRYDGRLSGSFRQRPERAPALAGTAELHLDGLTVDSIVVARSLDAVLESDGFNVMVTSADGNYAGGQVQLDGRWSLGRGTKLVTARLTRADGKRLLIPINKAASSWAGGIISGRATIEGSEEAWPDLIRVTGAVDLKKGTTFGVPIGEAHSPVSLSIKKTPLAWKASFPAIRSRLAKGRLVGELSFSSAGAGRSGLHIDSDWRLTHVDFENLLSTFVGTSTIGRGDLTGDFQLGGRNVRSARDLEGRLRVRLGGTDATAVPGLSAAGSLLGATALAGVRFSSGEAVARISKGHLLLDHVSMSSDRVGVVAHGKVGLLDLRLDVDAIISTGSFQGQDALLRQIGQQALVDTIPIGRVNRILSDRTIVIKLVGPTRDPMIRLMTGETLQANVKRFAVQEALGIVVVDSLLFD